MRDNKIIPIVIVLFALLCGSVAADDFSGKWEVCGVLNVTGESCDDWWFNATGSNNLTVGNYTIFNVSILEDILGVDRVNESRVNELIEDKLLTKDYALKGNVVSNNVIVDYVKKDSYQSLWSSELSNSLVINGTLWSSIDSQIPEKENIDWVKVISVVNLVVLIVMVLLVGRMYLE